MIPIFLEGFWPWVIRDGEVGEAETQNLAIPVRPAFGTFGNFSNRAPAWPCSR